MNQEIVLWIAGILIGSLEIIIVGWVSSTNKDLRHERDQRHHLEVRFAKLEGELRENSVRDEEREKNNVLETKVGHIEKSVNMLEQKFDQMYKLLLDRILK